VALNSVSLALSQAPAYTARWQTLA